MKRFMQMLKNRLKKMRIFENRKLFFLAPLVIVLVALICGTIYQLSPKYDKFANVGVDFQGGTLLNVEMVSTNPAASVDMNKANRDYNVDIISKVVESHGFEIATSQASGESAIVVRYSFIAYGNDPTRDAVNYGTDEMTVEMKNLNDKIMADIETAFENDAKYKDIDVAVTTTASLIGTSSSVKLLKTALISVSIALAVMFLYIIIRFGIFSATSAIAALMHDVIMMLAFTVIFRVEIGSTIVAAIITIVAYSINSTIVVFDRLREYVKPFNQANKRFEVGTLVNDAIVSTFTRGVYSSLTTLITISILAIMGVSSIRTFALPIIFGLIAGFYSSAFLAAPLWGMMTMSKDKRNKNKKNTNRVYDKPTKSTKSKGMTKFAPKDA